MLRKGWERIALFANFFMPGSLVTLETGAWLSAAPRTPMPELGWGGAKNCRISACLGLGPVLPRGLERGHQNLSIFQEDDQYVLVPVAVAVETGPE